MRREGWLRVSSSRGVRRLFVVSDGFVVKCYAAPPGAAPKRGSVLSALKSKARVSFDLRRVTTLGPATRRNPAAPAWVIDVVAESATFAGIHLTFDFGYKGEMREWLRIWANAVPAPALPGFGIAPMGWAELEELRDEETAASLQRSAAS